MILLQAYNGYDDVVWDPDPAFTISSIVFPPSLIVLVGAVLALLIAVGGWKYCQIRRGRTLGGYVYEPIE